MKRFVTVFLQFLLLGFTRSWDDGEFHFWIFVLRVLKRLLSFYEVVELVENRVLVRQVSFVYCQGALTHNVTLINM